MKKIMLLAILQIFLLVNFAFAQSNLIAESSGIDNKIIINLENIGKETINFLFWITSLDKFELVSAIEEGCCEMTLEGAWCIDGPAECDTSSDYRTSTQSCEETNYCSIGFCYDDSEGLCSSGSPRGSCEEDGGIWSEEENTNLCRKGCCELERNTQFVTEKRCEILSERQGFGFEFDLSIPENECRYISPLEGACIYGETECSFTTEIECATRYQGQFSLGEFCSSIIDSEPEHHSGCIEGEKDVFWFDSEDNKEGVKEECIFVEETCAIESGEGYCKNLGCEDGKKNGESWCVYDSFVGDGKDTAGSEHFKATCIDGETLLEASNYRDKICAEKTPEGADKSVAQLRPNLGFLCSKIEEQEECEEVPDCKFLPINIAENFYFNACVPKYPKGFDIYSTSDRQNGNDICSIASLTCTYIDQKMFNWGALTWECVDNCDCKEEIFSKKMNQFCTNLGDCGTDINYVGIETDNIRVTGGAQERIYANNYFENENTEDNVPKFLRLSNQDGRYMSDFAFFGENFIPDYDEGSSFNAIMGWGSAAFGAASIVALTNWWNPAGWVAIGLMVGGLITGLLGSLLGVGDTRERDIGFECGVWEPPIGGDDCSLCNEDPLKKCTSYRCESLGTSCGILEGTINSEYPICYNLYSEDLDIPEITFNGIDGDYIVTTGANGVEIKKSDNTCIDKFVKVNLSILTNELARCRWDEELVDNYAGMSEDFYEISPFVEEHFIQEMRIIQDDLLQMNILCQDPAGNIDRFQIELCISPVPDELSPIIESFNPPSGSYFRLGETSKEIQIYLNEPSLCKFSKVENQEYSLMNNMSCTIDAANINTCQTTITGLNQTQNKIYFKCEDEIGNLQDGYTEYNLLPTSSELQIISATPEGILRENYFELKVKTSGGMDNGNSICKYDILECAGCWDYLHGEEKDHSYEFTNFYEGESEIEITCEDEIGNSANTSLEINVEIDRSSPIVVRAYESSGKLKIITNEDAKCRYDFFRCNFDWENGTKMTTATSVRHTAEWINGQTYYIKCEDLWENRNPSCAIKVSPTQVL